MRITEMLTIYDYNYWATARILAAAVGIEDQQFVAPAAVPWGSLCGTLVHMLDTEWQGRALVQRRDRPTPLRDEDFPTVAALAARWREDESEMRAYLASLRDDDLSSDFDLGRRGAQPLWQLLMHLVVHGTQHRSEAAMLLTDFGRSPGDLDFFLFTITPAIGNGQK